MVAPLGSWLIYFSNYVFVCLGNVLALGKFAEFVQKKFDIGLKHI